MIKSSEHESSEKPPTRDRVPFPSYSHLGDPEADDENIKRVQDTPNSVLTQEDVDAIFQGRKSLNFDVDLDDDDDSILSSSDESMASLTLQEKRIQNIQRNAQRHLELFGEQLEKIKNSTRTKKIGQDYYDESDDDLMQDIEPRGMLMRNIRRSFDIDSKEAVGIKAEMKNLIERYPGRELQIRQLTSIFRATIGQVCGKQGEKNTSVYVPAPIFVVGASGTGKTSIAQACLQTVSRSANVLGSSCFGTAYINCSTLEPSTIGRLVTSVYTQLQPPEYRELKRRKRRLKRRRQGKTKQEKNEGRTEGLKNVQERALENHPVDDDADTNQANEVSDDELHAQERRVQPTRTVKKIIDEVTSFDTQEKNSTVQNSATLENSENASNSVETVHSVIVSLGRTLQPFYGVGSRRSAFVILDQSPERLLSLSATNNRQEKTNLLSELLLLPKVMKLNLTFIIITKNITLHDSRLNNIASTDKSQATISRGLHPVLVQFPAYKGNDSFLNILKRKESLEQVIGKYPVESTSPKSFWNKALDTFLVSLVQFLGDSTRDINDFVRIGRFLWPLYIAPVQADNIDETLNTIRGRVSVTVNNTDPSTGSKLLAYLGKRFLHYTAALSQDEITGLLIDSSRTGRWRVLKQQCDVDVPYLQSCLLLAAFICQNNRSDQDRKVFVAEANGKKRKRKRDTRQGDDEQVAYSSSTNELKQLHSLRPRPFQLERVFSIFATLVRLNPSKAGDYFAGFDDEKLKALGSSHLHKDLSELVDSGYLHRTKFTGTIKNEQINFNGAKFWCSLTREEATRLAKKIAIPLDNYIF